MDLEKLAISDINSKSLKEESDGELLNLHRHLHGLWSIKRKEPSKLDVSLEDIWNAHKLVAAEMEAREMVHASPMSGQKLPQKTEKAIPCSGDEKEDLAPVKPSGKSEGPEITLEEVLQHIKSFKIRQPLLYLTGGIVNNGKTANDIDFQVKGEVSPALLKIIQFRLGRMLPKELSTRVSLMTDEFDGPFTNNIPLGDLMFKRNDNFQILRMSDPDTYDEAIDFIGSEDEFLDSEEYTEIALQKQDSLMFYPAKPGKRPAVIQLHFRGKSTHGDFRFDIGDELIGWTAFWQLAGKLKDINTVEEGRKVISDYSMETGNNFLKPILAPKALQFTPKKPEPKDWLAVEGTVDPGEVGATAEQEGVFVLVEDPKTYRVEWGMQKPHFHEYFLTNGKHINGVLYVRLLSSRGFDRAGNGPTFWRGFISKNHLPSVLHTRTVRTGDMPPDGISGMPLSLMNQTPKEFKFWEEKGKKAKEIRDALVESKYFTEENVQLVNNEFVRVEKEKKRQDVRDITKKKIRFVFQYQMWKGQTVVRVGPSKEQWIFYLFDKESGNIPAFVMEHDPTKNKKVAAVRDDRSRDYAELEGEIAPGDLGNPTKNTPSFISKIDDGEVNVFEDSPGFIKFEVKLPHIKGTWTLTREEPDSDLWKVEFVKKAPAVEKGIMADEEIFPSLKADFAPLIRFDPLKPKPGHGTGEFFSVDDLIEKFAKHIFAGKGKIVVNPKWNGFRIVAEKKGDGDSAKVLIFFEDKQDDRSKAFPKVVEELKKIKGDIILDSELLEFNDNKEDLKNRKELVRWAVSDESMDDSKVFFRVFHIPYWNESLLREPYYPDIVKLIDDKIKGLQHFEPTPWKLASNEKELREAIEWASRQPGSEGAMVKLAGSTYTLGGNTSSWVKYKVPRILHAIILGKHKVAKTKETWNFEGGIGPIPKDQADKYTNTKELNGKTYVIIGQTFNTNLQGEVGDIVTITASEVFYEEQGNKTHLRWFIPIVTALNEAKEPTSVEHAKKLGLGEITKKEFYTPICKVDDEQRMVYGIVLEPNVVDSQGDIVSEEEIAKACHWFMEQAQNIGYQHKDFKKKFRIMECYLAPVAFNFHGQDIRKGTWLMAVRVLDDGVWEEVKKGEITGFSIGGTGTRVRRNQ